MTTTNQIAAMFNIDVIKKAIANCPDDEIVILCGNWSINKPRYEDNEDYLESADDDFREFEDMLGVTLYVSDYDDLIADPHGVMNN